MNKDDIKPNTTYAEIRKNPNENILMKKWNGKNIVPRNIGSTGKIEKNTPRMGLRRSFHYASTLKQQMFAT